MRIGMIAQNVAFLRYLPDGIPIMLYVLANQEERGMDAIIVQDFQDLAGIRFIRPIIECQGDHLLLRLNVFDIGVVR